MEALVIKLYLISNYFDKEINALGFSSNSNGFSYINIIGVFIEEVAFFPSDKKIWDNSDKYY